MKNKLECIIGVIFYATLIIAVWVFVVCAIITTKNTSKMVATEQDIEESIAEPKIILSDQFEIAYMEMIDALGMQDVDSIVYAQALLESGRFTNARSWDTWNFLGIMKDGKLRQFDSWIEGLVYYKRNIYDKWDKKCDYYEFLIKLGYATDPNYIKKLKSIK